MLISIIKSESRSKETDKLGCVSGIVEGLFSFYFCFINQIEGSHANGNDKKAKTKKKSLPMIYVFCCYREDHQKHDKQNH